MDQHMHGQVTGRSEGSAQAAFVGGGRVLDPGAGAPERQPPQVHRARSRSTGWYLEECAGVLTLSRAASPRFDFAVETDVPPVRSRRRLAHQVRQDMWRALQDLRGFSPVVRVMPGTIGLRLVAGGAVNAASFPRTKCEHVLQDLLDCPRHRARWLRHAGGPNA